MISLTVLMGVHFVSADSSSLIHIFFLPRKRRYLTIAFSHRFPISENWYDANLWPSVILHFEIELLFGLISPLFGVIRPRSFPFLRASPKEKCESQTVGIWGHGAYTSENTFSQFLHNSEQNLTFSWIMKHGSRARRSLPRMTSL